MEGLVLEITRRYREEKGKCAPGYSWRSYSSGADTQQQKVNRYTKEYPTVVNVMKKTNKGLRKRLVGGHSNRSKEGNEGTR